MKVGQAARDIFSATTSAPARTSVEHCDAPSATPVPVTVEQTVKATVVLRTGQIVALDRLSAEIRARTGASIRRAELLRAMIDAVLESKLELSSSTSENDVRVRIASSLGTERRKDGKTERRPVDPGVG